MGKGGDTVKGAAGGAAMGTAILPGWGTAIGAAVGGVAGYIGSEDDEKKPQLYDSESWQAQNARHFESDPSQINHAYDVQGTTSRGATIDQTQANQSRGQMQGLATTLTSAANGQGPSGAGMAGQAQRDSALSQAAALQAGRRGTSAAAGARMAGNQIAMGQQQANQSEAIGRVNEMQGARGQLGGLLTGMRGQDLDVASQQAHLGQQNNQYNASNQQAANLANQGRQYGAAEQELMARQHQEDMRFTNLNPGRAGTDVGGDLLNAGATMGAAYLASRNGGGGEVQKLAKGGYIDHPTLAVIGEAGPEMVVPLGKGHEQMQGVARELLDKIPFMKEDEHVHESPKVTLGHAHREPAVTLGHAYRDDVPRMANGAVVNPQQTLSIGTRLAPNFNTAPSSGRALAMKGINNIASMMLVKSMEDRENETELDKQRKLYGGYTKKEVMADPDLKAKYFPGTGTATRILDIGDVNRTPLMMANGGVVAPRGLEGIHSMMSKYSDANDRVSRMEKRRK